MRYANIRKARFIGRPNRFVATVWLDGIEEAVHVKNTGRCRELLTPGAEVWLAAPGTLGRKLRYDLVTVRKESGLLVNIDSQAPNKVAAEWLQTQAFDRVRPEYSYGGSRIDFFMTRGQERFLMEVKGCTLEMGGVGYFPDAPTERGVRHLYELTAAAREGYHAILAFVIQMDRVVEVCPNEATHPAFAEALNEAEAAGVRVIFIPCHVEPDGLEARPNGISL